LNLNLNFVLNYFNSRSRFTVHGSQLQKKRDITMKIERFEDMSKCSGFAVHSSQFEEKHGKHLKTVNREL